MALALDQSYIPSLKVLPPLNNSRISHGIAQLQVPPVPYKRAGACVRADIGWIQVGVPLS
jgi:hypothetical protein